MEGMSKLSAHWWWFDTQTNTTPRKSPWLHSTLAGKFFRDYKMDRLRCHTKTNGLDWVDPNRNIFCTKKIK
ncbi:hypothetical protein Hanom_Chr11g01021671 [Helianthus anomalus]